VRVRSTSATEAAGLAGRTGQVYGETIPSKSGVRRDQIIGDLKEDYAVNVHFADLNKSEWFTRDLLEFVDHAPGTEVGIGAKKWVRTATGEWIGPPNRSTPEAASNVDADNRRVKVIMWIVFTILVIIVLSSIVKRR
jgi:hypothetical protein